MAPPLQHRFLYRPASRAMAPPFTAPPPRVLGPPIHSRSPPLLPSEEAVPLLGPGLPSGRHTVPGQAQRAAGALRNVMQCLGVRRRSRSQSRSRELYLQEQSLEVAALNEQRLGKGCRAPPSTTTPEICGGWEGSWDRTQTVCS